MPVTFPVNSTNGTTKCVPLGINPDNLVESEEHFVVMLAMVTSGTSLSLGNNMLAVTLIDDNGKVILCALK